MTMQLVNLLKNSHKLLYYPQKIAFIVYTQKVYKPIIIHQSRFCSEIENTFSDTLTKLLTTQHYHANPVDGQDRLSRFGRLPKS